MNVFRNGSRVPQEVTAAQAGLDAIGMHALGRELTPNADGTPQERLTAIQIRHIGQTLSLPVVNRNDSEKEL
ncbi:MAG: hypothetical protein AAB462_03770 [Patescibacteria group bacterium]